MSNNVNNIVAEIKSELHSVAAAIKEGVAQGLDWVKSEAMKVVVLATQTNFGTKLLNLVSLFDNDKTISGAERMNRIVAALIGVGEDLLAAGGWSGLFASVKHFLQGAIQLVFNDFAAGMAKLKTA